jgi:hypothetical protein
MLSRFSVQNMAKEKKEQEKKIRQLHQRSLMQKVEPVALNENVCDYMLGLGNIIYNNKVSRLNR